MVFDAQFGRTNLPSQLLWGPGDKAGALAWLENSEPDDDEVEYLDRIFALQVHGGKVYLPRRPEVALALPAGRRTGEWRLVRADFPNDALAHLRHIKDGTSCTMQPPEGCPIEELFVGNWHSVTTVLADQYKITAPATVLNFRVPPIWPLAPHIGADWTDRAWSQSQAPYQLGHAPAVLNSESALGGRNLTPTRTPVTCSSADLDPV